MPLFSEVAFSGSREHGNFAILDISRTLIRFQRLVAPIVYNIQIRRYLLMVRLCLACSLGPFVRW